MSTTAQIAALKRLRQTLVTILKWKSFVSLRDVDAIEDYVSKAQEVCRKTGVEVANDELLAFTMSSLVYSMGPDADAKFGLAIHERKVSRLVAQCNREIGARRNLYNSS